MSRDDTGPGAADPGAGPPEVPPSPTVEDLVPDLYHELKRLARSMMRGERNDHTLQTTGLVNEACLRMLRLREVAPSDRRAFFAMAARVMRRVLVDYARRRNAGKRWPAAERVAFDRIEEEAGSFFGYPNLQFTELEDALIRLSDAHPRQGHVVELLYFVGLTQAEASAVLGVTTRTVERDWRFARLWLIDAMLDATERAP